MDVFDVVELVFKLCSVLRTVATAARSIAAAVGKPVGKHSARGRHFSGKRFRRRKRRESDDAKKKSR